MTFETSASKPRYLPRSPTVVCGYGRWKMSTSLPYVGKIATAQVDGLQIRLARGGRSEGVPILLTSPWPESIYAFREVLPEIEAFGPLIAVDLPGFGQSESH